MKNSGWFWDWAAKGYDRRARRDEDLTRNVERIRKYLEAEDTVLDYACGTGVTAFEIASDVKEVHAIDTSAGMIEVARQRALEDGVANVHFAQKTIFDEGHGRASFDVILAFNILHLVEDASAVVRRAGELLKPSGLLISVTPCLGEAGVVLRTLLPLIAKAGILAHLSSLEVSDVKELMRGGGLEIVESEVPGGRIPSYLAIARKG